MFEAFRRGLSELGVFGRSRAYIRCVSIETVKKREEDVLRLLSGIREPATGTDLVTLGAVHVRLCCCAILNTKD